LFRAISMLQASTVWCFSESISRYFDNRDGM